MRSRSKRAAALTSGFALAQNLLSWAAPAEPDLDAAALPRVPPVEATKALQTFQLRPGFHLDLAAAEPLVADPIALTFDENGRLFVVEMRDYSERRQERLGRVRLLEDADGDGRFDKATVYAEDLAWPTAVICYDGGIFVGATPDLLYLKDTTGDGLADQREIVFTGFGEGVPRLNVQQLLNSFNWGLDNRIHGANGGNGGRISSPARPNETPLDLRGRDFSFDPRTRELRAESGGGQYGMSFDDRGRKFVCSNSSHIRAVMFEERYASRNPLLSMPPPSVNIAADGDAAEVYRLSPEEPWRVIRTKWRVAGLVPGPIEGGGRASGYFTSATGITIYRGDAWGHDYRGDAFIADVGSNLLHRKKVRAQGAGFVAERPPGEEEVEFLASRDLWFRPVQMANGPDGNLYVIDMYREVIEHPWSFPASIKKHLDLNSGNDRGRIYRLRQSHASLRTKVQLGHASTEDLVQTLAHPNGWHRDTAARLLYQRQDRRALEPLRTLSQGSQSEAGRLHALYALRGLGELALPDVLRAMQDPAPTLRRHGVRLLEEFRNSPNDPLCRARLKLLPDDPDPEVRYQLAFTLGALPLPDRLELLERLAQRDAADPWIRLAILNSVGPDPVLFLTRLFSERTRFANAEGPFLRQLTAMVGAKKQPAELNTLLGLFQQLDAPALRLMLARALGEGVQRAGGLLWRACDPSRLRAVLAEALQLANAHESSPEIRLEAIRVLGHGPSDEVREPLLALLEPGQSAEVQKAALETLAGFPAPGLAVALLKAWDRFTPPLRALGIDALLRRSERIDALLTALESGQIRRSELSAAQVAMLRESNRGQWQARAVKVLGQPPAGARAEVLSARAGALTIPGRAAHGQAIFAERCAACHRLAGEGHALGPDLETVRSSGKDILLANIIDPNREVMPKYLNYLVETRDGDTLTGLVSVETQSSVVLKQANGVETTLLRSNIAALRGLGQSAMPEGLEEGLSDEALADLLEYILTAKAAQTNP